MASVRKYYSNQYEDKRCQLCLMEDEDQIHLFRCPKILDSCKELANNLEIEFEDIFGSLSKQAKAVKMLMKIWDTREELILHNMGLVPKDYSFMNVVNTRTRSYIFHEYKLYFN